MKTITKDELIKARQHVNDTMQTFEAHTQRDLTGLSNEAMVDVELESIHLATQRDLAVKSYQDMLHRYYFQEQKMLAEIEATAKLSARKAGVKL